MFEQLDLRKLAEMTAQDRAFLSLYLSRPQSMGWMERRFRKIRKMLSNEPARKDEREHFDENVKAVRKYLEKNPFSSGSLCILSCRALDFLEAVPLKARVSDLVWIDSSPYIRPLAELQDEYENIAVVVADNKNARIYLVSSAVAGTETNVEGNIKNHVKKGGWSQKRYQRRRDNELLHYARDIRDALTRLDQEESFRRIILVGSKEILRIVEENLPAGLAKRTVGRKAVHLGAGEESVRKEIWELYFEEERRSEKRLWEAIEGEYLRGGLGVVGVADVWEAAQGGRVEKVVVNRTYIPKGTRCRKCGHMDLEPKGSCTSCGSDSVYPVGIVNEIVEMLKRTGAEADFVDPIPSLTESGEIAALLRY